MESSPIVVEGIVTTVEDDTNVRDDALSFALDQRAFGPGRLLVAFADADGRFRGLAHARRTDQHEAGLEPCIQRVGIGATAAIAYCDEPAVAGPPPAGLADRFGHAVAIAQSYGIHLVDWFAYDDHMLRSSRLALYREDPCGTWRPMSTVDASANREGLHSQRWPRRVGPRIFARCSTP